MCGPRECITLVCHASLWSPNGKEERNIVVNPRGSGEGGDAPEKEDQKAAPIDKSTVNESRLCQALVGSLATPCTILTDTDGSEGMFFVFYDLSVRTQGSFRLKFHLIDADRMTDYLHTINLEPLSNISSINPAILLHKIDDVHFADASVYEPEDCGADPAMPFRYFVKEAVQIARMVNSQDPNRHNLHLTTYNILRKEVDKMRDFMEFRNSAVATVTDVFNKLGQNAVDDFGPSAGFLDALARTLDMFVILDAMKSIKGSMNNDFSLFKRSLPNLPKDLQIEDQTILHHKIYLFLGQQDQFIGELKKSLQATSGYDEILVDFVNFCAETLESTSFVLPETKHVYLRAMAVALWLLDDASEEKDISKRKRLKLDRFGKIFKASPVVPLFGDMPVSLSTIYGKAPHLSGLRWDATENTDAREHVARTYLLHSQMEDIRAQFNANLAQIRQSLHLSNQPQNATSPLPISERDATVYAAVLNCVKLLSMLTRKVMEQTAWKFSNPINRGNNASIPANATAYELAVRYNYTEKEKSNLVEEGFAAVTEAISRHVQRTIQMFMRTSLAEFIVHSAKKKRSTASILKIVRDYAVNPSYDDIVEKPRAKEKAESAIEQLIATQSRPHTVSQIHFIRALLEYCISDKSKGMKGGLLREKDLKKSQIVEIEKFLEASVDFRHMIDLQGLQEQ
ncbi:Cytoplasmic FMR1-interacting protein 2 [Irineochytrium annulatum]|nr:Cytoplasmic FMR1-interacting protein 2 [Irineochytrium annulatum]